MDDNADIMSMYIHLYSFSTKKDRYNLYIRRDG